jgi:1,4-dihydroxy-2-naphthoyl-CoA synthase
MSTAKAPVGQIRTEVHGHVLKIIIDNPAKKNSFSPQMMFQMSDALTLLDKTDESFARKAATSQPASICRSFSVRRPRTGT